MAAWNCGRWMTLGAILALSSPLCSVPAEAARPNRGHYAAVHASARAIQAGAASYSRHGRYASVRYGRVGGGLQCVPFARENSGIELSGNAATWWGNAEGVYERGGRPEVGSVLNFRANGRMRMGHVAVVSRVMDGRNVEIDHANWSGPGAGRGGISRNIGVVDVSPANDWTAVRVALGNQNEFGSVYPTYGFIYDRPDRGTMVANSGVAGQPLISPTLISMALNPAPRDLRPLRDRLAVVPDVEEEVAEAADDVQPRLRRSASRGNRRYVVATKSGHGASFRGASLQTISAKSIRSAGVGAQGAGGRSGRGGSARSVSAHIQPAKSTGHGSHRGRHSF